MKNFIKILLILLIRGYQKFISPLTVSRCRFYPTCSEYSIQALKQRGILQGGILSIWRILRCNPFHSGGYDELSQEPTLKAELNRLGSWDYK